MRKLLAGVLAGAVIAFIGCSTPSSKVGGPGAVPSSGKDPLIGKKAGTFTLDLPTVKVKQGDEAGVPIGIKRGPDLEVDVTIKFENPPKGITFTPAIPMIKHGDNKVDVKVKAADDAALGEQTIKVTAHPSEGKDLEDSFKLTVEKK